MSMDELFKLKIAALLHDPPHKPYLLVKKKSHEEEAKEFVREVFTGDAEEVKGYLSDNRCILADKLASTIDRWTLSILSGEKYVPGTFYCSKVVLKNIVNPRFSIELQLSILYNKKYYNVYIDSLKKYLAKVRGWRERYLLLYLLYEPLWITSNLGIGPADTRTPTHTVFDHNYATAMMTNWTLDKDRIKGCLIGLDVAEVQNFIASSRKVRDAWISSYLVSALTWYTILELVETLGPDIVLVPTLRMNPFYLHWLKHKFNLEVPHSLEELVFFSSDVRDMYSQLGIPPYPLIPGRVTLVTPPWDNVKNLLKSASCESPYEYFSQRFKEGWQRLWKSIEAYAKARLDIVNQEEKIPWKEERVLWEFICKVFEYYHKEWRNTGFDKEVPLNLRAEVVEVNVSPRDPNLWRVYDAAYGKLTVKLGAAKLRSCNPTTKLRLYELTMDTFRGLCLGFPEKSKRGFEYCTCCGKLPSLIVLPRDEVEYENRLNGVVKSLSSLAEDDRRHALTILKTIFSPGERLCPWCFLKRVLSLEPRLLNILLLAVDNYEEYARKLAENEHRVLIFPSTSRIASIGLYRKLCELDKGRLEDLLFRIEFGKHIPVKLVRKLPKTIFMADLYGRLWRIGEKLTEENKWVLYTLCSLDPEELWFSDERRGYWDNLLKDIGLNRWLWRYYALVRADGDSIGSILTGELTVLLGVSASIDKRREFIKQYIIGLCEGGFKNYVKGVLDGEDTSLLAKILIRELGISMDEAVRRVKQVKETFGQLLKDLKIPVTPTYHVAISSALMRSALLDIAIVNRLDGFTVYAGGDDLLAFIPVDKVFDVVYVSRRVYGGFRLEEAYNRLLDGRVSIGGFIKSYNAYIPMLPGMGKSYCVCIAHYHYPLKTIISSTLSHLDKAKDECLLHYLSRDLALHKSKKDVIVLVYTPRGGEEYTVLPLSWSRPIVDESQVARIVLCCRKLLEYIDDRVGLESILSHSLLYHFIESRELILELCRSAGKDPNRARDVFELLDRVVFSIFKRGLKSGYSEDHARKVYDRLFRALEDYVVFGIFTNGEREFVNALSIADAVRLVLSGLR